ncbi:MAG: hypothetical protein ACJ8AT_16070 [Hyalangium sp.]|uniref:hypothetical protein n=1 Tax=Hyalangium sp. TaxID=2028555 RepID=UPI00389A7339
MRKLPLLAAMLLMSCLRNSSSAPERLEEDTSIVFPKFYERFPITVGKQGQLYELDGVTLRAIAIAANDFIPPQSKERQCWDRQEAQLYRVIRQGDIVFVRIDGNPEYCKPKLIMFDSGVEYAISADGRILRRRFDGEPNGPLGPSDAGTQESFAEPVPYSKIGVGSDEPVAPLPAFLRRDGGVRPDAGQPDGGPEDGGASAGPSK